jgi:hypothetical protein
MAGCLKRLANCALITVLLALLALGAAYYYVLPRLDLLLADAVRREFMLPPSSTVVIMRGSLLDTLEGQVDRFYVSSPEAKISGLSVENVEFNAGGIQFDLPRTLLSGQAELLSVDQGDIAFRVSDEELKQRWATELAKKGLSKTEVILEEDKVSVSCVLDLKLTEVRIGATGELYVDGTDRIKFKATDLELAGSNIGIDELKAVFSTLTPVIDLGQFKMSVAIDELRMREGYLYVVAHSMSLTDKRALEQAQREPGEHSGEPEAGNGTRLRIPSLDELKNLFVEEVETEGQGEDEGAAEDETEDGEAGGDGEQSANEDSSADDTGTADSSDNSAEEGDGEDEEAESGPDS